jgi:hypothetical protein
LEHLRDPWKVLAELVGYLEQNGHLYVALPNPLVLRHRIELLFGRFRYREGGAFDAAHLRWFDWEAARELVQGSGVVIVKAWAEGHVPLGPLRRVAPRACFRMDTLGPRVLPGLFGDQFLFVGRRP